MTAAEFVAAQAENERFGFWANVYCGHPEACLDKTEQRWDSVTTRGVLERLHGSLVVGRIRDPLENGSLTMVVAFGQVRGDNDDSVMLIIRYETVGTARMNRVFVSRDRGRWSVDSSEAVAWADIADSLAPRKTNPTRR